MSSGKIDPKRIPFFPNFVIFKKKIETNANHELIKDKNLDMAKKIHFFLKNSQNLTQQQKYDYCNNQRSHMKLYLKKLSESSIK